MKKNIFVKQCLSIVMMGSLLACSNPKPTQERLGNTCGNLLGQGLYAQAGEWIYYTDMMNGNHLTKIKTDDSSKTVLSEDSAISINVIDDWIYYVNFKDGQIHRIKTDGTNGKTLTSFGNLGYFSILVVSDTIYFSNPDDQGKFYTIKTDGSNMKRFLLNGGNFQCFDGESLYYMGGFTDKPESYGIRKVNIASNEDELLVATGSYAYLVYEGWVYYSDGAGPLVRIQTDGKNKMTLTQTQTKSFNIINGRLVTTNYDGPGITIMNLDGSSPTVIADADASFLYEINDWIYYINNDQWGRIYRVKTDGTLNQKGYTVAVVAPDPEGSPVAMGSGASNGNLLGESLFVRSGEWIYYSSRGEEKGIFKSKVDGTERTVVAEVDAMYLNLVTEWLYFIGYFPYKGSLMRMKLDGTQFGIVLDVYAAELVVKDGWMYFTDYGQNHQLYKIKTDGTALTQLSQDPVYNINLTQDWIIYTDVPYSEDETKKASIYKVKQDGTQTTRIIETRFSDAEILAVGDWVYYWNEGYEDLDSLRLVNLEGTIDTRVLLGHVRLMGVTEKHLYVNVSNDTMMSGLVRYDLNGTNPLILVRDGAHFEMCLLDDKIIYRNITGQGIRIMNLSGTNNLKLLNE